MKSILSLVVLAALLMLGITACSSLSGLPPLQQQFQAGCTIVNGDLNAVALSPFVNADQKKMLTEQIIPANQAVCAAGGQLNLANLKTIHDSLLPMALTIVEAVPALPQQQMVLFGLRAFGPLVQAQIDMLLTIATPAATPASAPAAASTPLAGAPLQ